MNQLPVFNQAEKDMMEGYLDGSSAKTLEYPEYLKHNRSPAYEHGWLNARDDKLHYPRASATVLRARVKLIIDNMEDY
jgi:hypothetical protein